jgi:hypothetical protein
VIPHSTLGWLFQERQQATFHQPSRIKDAHLIKQLIAMNALSVLPTQPLRDSKAPDVRSHSTSAIIDTGTKQIVLVAKGEGRFEPRVDRALPGP